MKALLVLAATPCTHDELGDFAQALVRTLVAISIARRDRHRAYAG